MKRSFLVTVAGLALLTGSALSEQPADAASDELDYFHGCVNQEIPAALHRSVVTSGGDDLLHRDHTDIVNSVFSVCKQRATDSSHRLDDQSYVYNAVEALFKQIEPFADLQQRLTQQWKDHPAQALEDQAMRAYSICLEGSARGRSRTSNDPPEAIAQASFAACAKNKQMILDTYRDHSNSFSPEAMTALEQAFQNKLPQIIIKTREARDVPPAPAPAASGDRK
jgi:hypothetical protein